MNRWLRNLKKSGDGFRAGSTWELTFHLRQPIVQGDAEVVRFNPEPSALIVVMLAMEYRSIASACLSKHRMSEGGIQLSPL